MDSKITSNEKLGKNLIQKYVLGSLIIFCSTCSLLPKEKKEVKRMIIKTIITKTEL
jgi:hypothetical protein